MFFKKIETDGLAQYSYLIGDADDIAVIDPMRDVHVYMHEARKAGMRIKYIFETHRNEDFVVGSMELAEKTGATIYISDHEDLGHAYGERIRDGFELAIGKITIKALLDIRDYNEMETNDPDENRVIIPLKTLDESLNGSMDKLDKKKTVYILCGSGNRATTAASYLGVKGYDVVVITGGVGMYRNLA